jgi:SAM-dependent methyltransferase
MSSLNKLQESWEGFAQVDPFWAICADAKRLGNRWTKEEFFATGQNEIGRVIQYVQSLGLKPWRTASALDFGCGVGRLTRAMARYFDQCQGVDISPTMIRMAKEFNKDCPGCHFWLNERDDLKLFSDGSFGFIYTSIVLQHMSRKLVERYLLELTRVLKVGGVFVFQVPERERTPVLRKLRTKVALRRRVNRLLGRRSVYAFHMEMHCFPEKAIRKLLSGQPVRIVDVKLTNSSIGSFNGDLRFLEQEPAHGFVSKQYCLLKTGQPGQEVGEQEQGAELF